MEKKSEIHKPIKRLDALQPLSRDHHHALLLVWKIRKGLKSKTELSRITKYVHWFYDQYLVPHFAFEEMYIYPILGDNALIIKALLEHRQLENRVNDTLNFENNLADFADLLESHIRFEERVLFNAIQNVATTEQLEAIKEALPKHSFIENETDKFWE
jgi:hemerythrin-like domain-containing protein